MAPGNLKTTASCSLSLASRLKQANQGLRAPSSPQGPASPPTPPTTVLVHSEGSSSSSPITHFHRDTHTCMRTHLVCPSHTHAHADAKPSEKPRGLLSPPVSMRSACFSRDACLLLLLINTCGLMGNVGPAGKCRSANPPQPHTPPTSEPLTRVQLREILRSHAGNFPQNPAGHSLDL